MPKLPTILSDQTKQILSLMQATLNQETKAEELTQETLTILIQASEYIATMLRFLRTVNYEDSHT